MQNICENDQWSYPINENILLSGYGEFFLFNLFSWIYYLKSDGLNPSELFSGMERCK